MVFGHRQLARNIFSSWATHGLRIIIAFFFIPFITSVLGDDRYGVWVILFQTINYFSLLDFGLEKAVIRYLSKFLSQRDFLNINRVLNTAWLTYLIVGTVIIAGVWLTAIFLFDYFKIGDAALLEEGRNALIIVGFYLGLRFYLLPFGDSLGGFQRYDAANAVYIVEEIIRVLVMVWLLANGYGLAWLALAILVVSLLRQIVTICWLKRLFPPVTMSLKNASRKTASDLFGYSRISFGITLAWLVIFNTDAILLGLLASTAAAGIYAPAAQLMLLFRNIVNSVGSPLTSAVSHWESTRDPEIVQQVYLKGIRYTSYLSFFITVGVIFWVKPFVALWLIPEFAAAANVMIILSVSSAFFIPQIIGNAVLFGIDKHRYLLYVLIGEASLKILLSVFLIRSYGITGMALAAAIPQLLLYTTLYPYLMSKAIDVPFGSIVRRSILSGLLAICICTPVAFLITNLLPPMNWLNFFAGVLLLTAVTVTGGYLILEPTDRTRLKRFVLREGADTEKNR